MDGLVYAIELAKKRTSIIPVIEDAWHPHRYCMLTKKVDMIFADITQPDQTRVVALNVHTFLWNGGHCDSITAKRIASTTLPEAV